MIEKGKCPKCGSLNLNYETNVDTSDEEIYYPFVCDDCGFEGKEYYRLKFITITSKSF